MLNRLYASLTHGPSMNARPHTSRQRVDLAALDAFRGRDARSTLGELLEKGSIEFPAKVPRFEALPEAHAKRTILLYCGSAVEQEQLIKA